MALVLDPLHLIVRLVHRIGAIDVLVPPGQSPVLDSLAHWLPSMGSARPHFIPSVDGYELVLSPRFRGSLSLWKCRYRLQDGRVRLVPECTELRFSDQPIHIPLDVTCSGVLRWADDSRLLFGFRAGIYQPRVLHFPSENPSDLTLCA